MVITNQTLFQSSIFVFESQYGFPLPYVILEDDVTLRDGGFSIELQNVSIFDDNGNPIIKPGNIVRYQDLGSGAYGQTIVVGYYPVTGWIKLADAINTDHVTIYQQNENEGCVLFVNGPIFGTGDIGVTLLNGAVVNYHIEATKDYLLPFIAKSIDSATSQNGIYALY